MVPLDLDYLKKQYLNRKKFGLPKNSKVEKLLYFFLLIKKNSPTLPVDVFY
jgi:hypothetical protein